MCSSKFFYILFLLLPVLLLAAARPYINSEEIDAHLGIESWTPDYYLFHGYQMREFYRTTVIPISKPKILYGLPEKRLVEGTRAELFCEASGNPAPQFDWFFGRTLLIDQEKYHQRTEEDPNGDIRSYLSINNLEKKDAGQYRCEAFSNEGRTCHTIDLTVLDKYQG